MNNPFEREEGAAVRETPVAPAVSDEESRQVRELIQALLKTKRAFEMYPANNPMLVKFQDDLVHRFEAFFSAEERLTLTIRQQDILYQGQNVYHNAEKDDNVALLFYKDGLRELTFTSGFTGDEVMDFVDVIRARPEATSETFDDDMVTLLWEKDFVHLTYYVVEEFSEGSSDEDEAAALLQRPKVTEGEFAEAYQDAIEEGSDEGIFTPLEAISIGFKGVFSLGEEEIKSLKEEMEGLTDQLFLSSAIDCLFETLYIQKGTGDFDVLLDNLDSALLYLINSGEMGMAAIILKRFRELEADRAAFNPRDTQRVSASISRAGSEALIRRFVDILNSGADISPEALQLYLSQLDKAALMPLSQVMGEVKDLRFRKSIIDSLVALGRGNMDTLVSALKDRRWEAVRNAVAILGRIGDKTAVDALKQTVNHPELAVRREVVRALGTIGGPKAGDALLLAVEDPDQQIRMTALRYLPRAQSYAVLDTLMEFSTRSDFIDRVLTEKRALFEVLAEIGQDRVLPYLVKTLRKKGFFDSSKKDELRACAAYGLGNINQREALDALEKELSRSKKGTVLYEAVSYSINKLARPGDKPAEA